MTWGSYRKGFGGLAAGLLLACGVSTAQAAQVDLDAYVTFSIVKNDTVTPLADGSWVVIVGSADNQNDGMKMTYDMSNVFVAMSVQGDDMILGVVTIGTQAPPGTGTFATTVKYNPDDIGYVYIRYFDTTAALTGLLYWGQSSVSNLIPTNFNTVTIDFAPDSDLIASNQDTFVVIPEPSTANLILLITAMAAALRFGRKRRAGAASLAKEG